LAGLEYLKGGLQVGKPLELDEIWSERIRESLDGIEFGMVQIIIHDGRIVQIERTERNRFSQEIKNPFPSNK
jgi:hypothetical protein